MVDLTDSYLRKIFDQMNRIAILGASLNPLRAGYYVSTYLHQVRFSIFPVNPTYLGKSLENRPFVASLSEIDEPLDTINIFRASHLLLAHLPEILALKPLPRLAWFQPGSHDPKVTCELYNAGITVIQQRCIFTEHNRLN